MDEGLYCRFRDAGPVPLRVELAVRRGETLAVVGASGSGKTTLLRAIAGLVRPKFGEVRCGGALWMDSGSGTFVPPSRRRIGLVSQHYALFPHRSARGNVMEAMLHLPRAARHAAAGEMLDRVGLAALAERLPGALSGGQRQRVAIARALARNPALLLLDEPFSAVDYPTRRVLRALVEEIRESFALPIILVSHDVEDALRLADTVCFLDDGACAELGTPQALLASGGRLARWIEGPDDYFAAARRCAE
ncbi:ABC transporter ATP-binding protein [Sphingomonas hengshuiensis]|uniref:ABC transporter domain-containing protein n=1 Tax=Sphingomonas hengshuiensis TaxID=1609977 RepID=A0A7U4J9G6_9SPHN|nr:ATP-binding cassette domain-containing protein [Sphingomonas hengshuiensis]AJP72683.1 hypothetical protein TS85_14220 [Sphingomonas hengshuiensis]